QSFCNHVQLSPKDPLQHILQLSNMELVAPAATMAKCGTKTAQSYQIPVEGPVFVVLARDRREEADDEGEGRSGMPPRPSRVTPGSLFPVAAHHYHHDHHLPTSTG